MVIRTAILVDSAFYQKRAFSLFGRCSPEERADELMTYCHRLLKKDMKDAKAEKHDVVEHQENYLYRIFVYDCPPSEKVIYHPLAKKQVYLKNTELYKWSQGFQKALISKRKVALRSGELLESAAGYLLTSDAVKKLCRGEIAVSDLTEKDFYLDIKQKGVDMRIGLDIASLSYKRLVDRIILIAGDSDFVPAAKHARREGIEFILDPMWHNIKPSLNEHIDGLWTCVSKPPYNKNDPLYRGPKDEAKSMRPADT